MDKKHYASLAKKLKDNVVKVMIPLARLEWRRAVYLAAIIGNPTYRNEMLYRVAESEAAGSGALASDFVKSADGDSLGNRPAPAGAAVPF